MTYEDAVKKIYDWQYQNTGSFFNLLVLAFRKADYENRARLASAYPKLDRALRDWDASADENELFRRHGLPIPGETVSPEQEVAK